MKQIFEILSVLLLIPLLFACTATSTPSPQIPLAVATDPPIAVTDPGFNLLVVAEGEVQLKRTHWSDYHLTAFGTILERGDLLKLSPKTKATVLCDGLTLWQVPTGAPAGLTNGCPQPSDKILVRGAAGIAGKVRGAHDPLIPYIISPRSTDLLSSTPTLRWNNTGAASYKVEVRGGDSSWSQTGVTQTTLIYPGQPALQPTVSYLLVVIEEKDKPKSSQDEGQVGLGFNLLKADEVKKVQNRVGQIERLGLPGEAEAFAQAQLYAGQGLNAEAIEVLEGLVKQGSQQATVHQSLADLYSQIGLWLLAEPRYVEAIKLAEAQGHLEAKAASQAGLGEVYAALGNIDKAKQWLTQAEASYKVLGDTKKAGEIAERLAKLK